MSPCWVGELRRMAPNSSKLGVGHSHDDTVTQDPACTDGAGGNVECRGEHRDGVRHDRSQTECNCDYLESTLAARLTSSRGIIGAVMARSLAEIRQIGDVVLLGHLGPRVGAA